MRAVALVLAVGSLLLAACSSASRTELPEEYLGRWYYLGSSGGITGDGGGDEPTGFIVIHGDGRIDHHREDGALITTSEYTVRRGPSILSTEDQWILNPETAMPDVITLSADGLRMALSQPVYDGFVREYARSR